MVHDLTCLVIASFLVLSAGSCGPPGDGASSDYTLYSAALRALTDSSESGRLLIRSVPAVDRYEDHIYDSGAARVFQGMAPRMDTALLRIAAMRLKETATLADSFDLEEVDHALLDEDLYDHLSRIPGTEARRLVDSLFGEGVRVACLTPPARIGDQALVFVALDCWWRYSLEGRHYFLEREAGVWKVEGIVPMSVN